MREIRNIFIIISSILAIFSACVTLSNTQQITPQPTPVSLPAESTASNNDADAQETGSAPAENGIPPAPDISQAETYIEVNVPATELTLYNNGSPVFTKRVAIGRGIYPTPIFESHIQKIEWNPTWYPPDSPWAKGAKITPPGPGNPLGLVKMPLSSEILFHGTSQASSVGRAASHGCMRMLNSDATELAWYLQSRFSQKSDQSFRDLYSKNSRTTYVVQLDVPISVRLVYRPVVVRGEGLIFYPDHYSKLAGVKAKKSAIIAELLRGGFSIECLDDEKIQSLAEHWPPRGTEVKIEELVRGAAIKPGTAPECS